MKTMFAAAAAMALMLAPMAAHAQDNDILKHLINSPNVGSWSTYGSQTSKKIADANVQGGQAFEVTVTAAGPTPYTTAAQQDVTGPIKKGDKIIVAVWLKATTTDAGGPKVHLRMQTNSAPYSAIAEGDAPVTGVWKMCTIQAIADADHPKGTASLAVHLGGVVQTVDLGPAFVLDMGPPAATASSSSSQ